MSADKINQTKVSSLVTNGNVTWERLIAASKVRISEHQSDIRKLHKSIRYFTKQMESGVPFPLDNINYLDTY
jgi:hypothetical protein